MKKNLLSLSAALISITLLLASCGQPVTENGNTKPKNLAEVFERIVIPDEQLCQSSARSAARSAENRTNLSYTAKTDNPSPYIENMMSTESRGSIFLYLLKYDFSKLDDIKNGDLENGITITWGNRKVSAETEKFIKDTQGDMVLNWLSYDENNHSQYIGFGELEFTGTLTDIKCKQINSNESLSFNHYIEMKENSNGYYDIGFYAYEKLPSGPNTYSENNYFEITKTDGASDFQVDYWEIKAGTSITSSMNLAVADLEKHRNLKFSNKKLKKYAYYNADYLTYSYGDYEKKTGVTKNSQDSTSNYSFGIINSLNNAETIRNVVYDNNSNITKDRYNILWVTPKSGTLIKPESDSHPSNNPGAQLDYSIATSSNCGWKLGNDNLVGISGLNVYIKSDIRNNNSYYEKAYYLDFKESKTEELFNKDSYAKMNFEDLKSNIDSMANDSSVTNTAPSTLDYDTITESIKIVHQL